jgi:hypothetical protein
MVHPQALVEPMGLPLRPNPQKKRKTNGMKFSNRDNMCTKSFDEVCDWLKEDLDNENQKRRQGRKD